MMPINLGDVYDCAGIDPDLTRRKRCPGKVLENTVEAA